MGELIPFPQGDYGPENTIPPPYYYDGPVSPLDIVAAFMGGSAEFAALPFEPAGKVIDLGAQSTLKNPSENNNTTPSI